MAKIIRLLQGEIANTAKLINDEGSLISDTLVAIQFNNRFSKNFWRFLRQIMPNGPFNEFMFILTLNLFE